LFFPGWLPPKTAPGEWKSAGLVDDSHSPYAKLHGVPIRAVKMGDGFWTARRKANVEKSIPTLLAELEQHGIVDNFLRLEGKKDVPRRGPLYTDSDLYKWMEAVAFVLQSGDQSGNQAMLRAVRPAHRYHSRGAGTQRISEHVLVRRARAQAF
jgi:hypothetical protein